MAKEIQEPAAEQRARAVDQATESEIKGRVLSNLPSRRQAEREIRQADVQTHESRPNDKRPRDPLGMGRRGQQVKEWAEGDECLAQQNRRLVAITVAESADPRGQGHLAQPHQKWQEDHRQQAQTEDLFGIDAGGTLADPVGE